MTIPPPIPNMPERTPAIKPTMKYPNSTRNISKHTKEIGNLQSDV